MPNRFVSIIVKHPVHHFGLVCPFHGGVYARIKQHARNQRRQLIQISLILPSNENVLVAVLIFNGLILEIYINYLGACQHL